MAAAVVAVPIIIRLDAARVACQSNAVLLEALKCSDGVGARRRVITA